MSGSSGCGCQQSQRLFVHRRNDFYQKQRRRRNLRRRHRFVNWTDLIFECGDRKKKKKKDRNFNRVPGTSTVVVLEVTTFVPGYDKAKHSGLSRILAGLKEFSVHFFGEREMKKRGSSQKKNANKILGAKILCDFVLPNNNQSYAGRINNPRVGSSKRD
jgi:hypothetical protein